MSIFNASDIPLDQVQPNLPSMSATLTGWFQNIVVGLLVKTLVNNRTVETTTDYETRGVMQPFTPEQLEIKAEGERSWKWFMLHCQPSLQLKTDDVVTIRGVRYRVMGKLAFDAYGYLQYELVDDYTTVIPSTQ
jgi:hypothetical protein